MNNTPFPVIISEDFYVAVQKVGDQFEISYDGKIADSKGLTEEEIGYMVSLKLANIDTETEIDSTDCTITSFERQNICPQSDTALKI